MRSGVSQFDLEIKIWLLNSWFHRISAHLPLLFKLVLKAALSIKDIFRIARSTGTWTLYEITVSLPDMASQPIDRNLT